MDKLDSSNSLQSMTPSDYMEKRVNDQLRWYGDKSALNKRWHQRLQIITLVAAALVPIVSLSSTQEFVRIIVAVIGSIAAIAAGVVALFQFRDLWVEYRSAAECIKYEKYLYLTGAPPYSNNDAFHLFVVRVESVIAGQNRGWTEKFKARTDEQSSNSEFKIDEQEVGN